MIAPIHSKSIPISSLSLAILVILLTLGCGTTSKMRPIEAGTTMQVSKYDKVVIHDFVDAVTEKTKAAKREEKRAEMQRIIRDFADMIVEEIQAKGGFHQVSRSGIPDEKTLIVNGRITRYQEGSAALRLFVGMGAGSSHFDAVVEFHDGATRESIGNILVDKNSWALGGGIAAGQSAQGFMRGAAKKVANELYELKTGQ